MIKFALSKRGWLLVAGALATGSAGFAWTQFHASQEIAWQDEIQAVPTEQTVAATPEDDVLPEADLGAVLRHRLPSDFAMLMADSPGAGRYARAHRDPLAALADDVLQTGGSANDGVLTALSHQSPARLSAVMGGAGGMGGGSGQFYAASARAKLNGNGGGGGGGSSAAHVGSGSGHDNNSDNNEDTPRGDEAGEPHNPPPPVIGDNDCTTPSNEHASAKATEHACPEQNDNPGHDGDTQAGGDGENQGGGDDGKPDDGKPDDGKTDGGKPEHDDKPKTVSVDEPGTLALLALGLIGLVASRRKGQHA